MPVENLKIELDNFIFDLKEYELANSSISRYKSIINNFIKYLEEQEIVFLTKLDYQGYKEYLKSNLKPKTINNYVVIINKYLTFLGFEDLKVKQLRVQKKLTTENVPSSVDYKRMVRVGNKKDLEETVLIIKTFAYTGCRVSELKNFTVEKLKESKKTKVIGFYSKGKYREIVIPKWLRRELLNYAAIHGIKTGYIFRSPRDSSKPIPRVTVWRKIHKLGGLAKIHLSKSHPHALRHLFGKEYLKYCKDEQQVQTLLGHSRRETTEIYTQLSREEMADFVDNFKI